MLRFISKLLRGDPPRVAKFERISRQQAIIDSPDHHWSAPGIPLPKRATSGSAGYDFFCPYDVTLKPGETVCIPTFVRCRIDRAWALFILPRSSLGFKYRIKLDNTIGLIDSDYYGAENEGHIRLKITNEGQTAATIKENDRMCQGVFLPFGETEDDDSTAERSGGIGSTGR